jgi:hypothetical protein
MLTGEEGEKGGPATKVSAEKKNARKYLKASDGSAEGGHSIQDMHFLCCVGQSSHGHNHLFVEVRLSRGWPIFLVFGM